MHTPIDAREKECPYLKTRTYCIAQQCMMWRWVPSETTRTELRVVERSMPSPTGDTHFIERVQVADAPTHGYCGLAGNP